MTSQGWLQIGLTLLIGLLISVPVGRYLARVVTDRKTPLDRLFDPIDNFIYLLIGRRISGQAMDWKAYTLHMLATNLVMALIIFLILVFQDYLPLNPGTSLAWSRCSRSTRRSALSPIPIGKAMAARRHSRTSA